MNYPKVLANPVYWIALILALFSVWCEWPIITLKTFPHFPFVRAALAIRHAPRNAWAFLDRHAAMDAQSTRVVAPVTWLSFAATFPNSASM